jgi:hypothetical protein
MWIADVNTKRHAVENMIPRTLLLRIENLSFVPPHPAHPRIVGTGIPAARAS